MSIELSRSVRLATRAASDDQMEYTSIVTKERDEREKIHKVPMLDRPSVTFPLSYLIFFFSLKRLENWK